MFISFLARNMYFFICSNKGTESHRNSKPKSESLLFNLFPMLVDLSFGEMQWPSWHLLHFLPVWCHMPFLAPNGASAWFHFEASFGVTPARSLLDSWRWYGWSPGRKTNLSLRLDTMMVGWWLGDWATKSVKHQKGPWRIVMIPRASRKKTIARHQSQS